MAMVRVMHQASIGFSVAQTQADQTPARHGKIRRDLRHAA
jgi:hypothetical protein